jgi:hypothetical protein
LPVHVRHQLAAVLELVQRELHHRRSGPRQWVHYDDCLRGSHVDRREDWRRSGR